MNVKWIKLSVNMFDDEKIRLIESMPDRDTILITWIKLLAQAGKSNVNGYLLLNQNIPYSEEMLSTIFNRPISTIRMAIEVFKRFGMIEIDDNALVISNWGKHQNIDGLDKIREQNKARQQKYREGLKALPPPKDEKSNVTVTLRNGTEKELEKEKEYIYSPVIEYLNEKAGTKYKPTGQKTKDLIKARQNDGFTLEDFKKVIDNKVADWKGSDYEKFLRPETLFSNKFEGYLNQKPTQSKSKDFNNPYRKVD